MNDKGGAQGLRPASLDNDGGVLRLVLSAITVMCLGACSPKSPSVLAPPPAIQLPQVTTNSLDPALVRIIGLRRQAVMASPGSSESWGRLGQAFDAAEFRAEARTCYAEGARLGPRSARWPYLLGLLQLQDQPELALHSLDRAATLSAPTNDAPRLRLARALIELGRWSEATNHLTILLAANPQHPAARVELARIRLFENQLSLASDLLAPCLTNPFTARPSVLLLSQVKARQGQPEVAAALASQAISLPKPFDWPDPFLREVQALRADSSRRADRINALLLQQRLPEAEAAVNRLLADAPEDGDGLLLLARLRIQQRRCEEAETVLKRHLAVHPESLNGLVQLGLARSCLSRWTDAATAFAQAVALKPDFAQAHYNLGLARARSGDPTGAIASWREAIRSGPGDPSPWVALAETYLHLGKLEDARASLERLESLDPKNPAVAQLRDRLR